MYTRITYIYAISRIWKFQNYTSAMLKCSHSHGILFILLTKRCRFLAPPSLKIQNISVSKKWCLQFKFNLSENCKLRCDSYLHKFVKFESFSVWNRHTCIDVSDHIHRFMYIHNVNLFHCIHVLWYTAVKACVLWYTSSFNHVISSVIAIIMYLCSTTI